MRRTRIVDLLRALNKPCGLSGRILHGNDLIIFAMKNKSWEVELFQVFGKVCLGKSFDAFVCTQSACLHAPEPELVQNSLRNLSSRTIGPVKLNCKFFVALRAPTGHASADCVKVFYCQAFRIRSSFYHAWWNG